MHQDYVRFGRIWLECWIDLPILFHVSFLRFLLPLVVPSLDPKNEVYPCFSYCFQPCCFHCFRTTSDIENQYPVSSWLRPYFPFLSPRIVPLPCNANLSLYRGQEELVCTQHFMLCMLNLISLLQLPTFWYVMIFSTWQQPINST